MGNKNKISKKKRNIKIVKRGKREGKKKKNKVKKEEDSFFLRV